MFLDPTFLAAQRTASAHDAWSRVACEELVRRSWRMRLVGARLRGQLVDDFLAATAASATETVIRADFERRVRERFRSPALVFFLLGIAWDILWWWWTHRRDESRA